MREELAFLLGYACSPNSERHALSEKPTKFKATCALRETDLHTPPTGPFLITAAFALVAQKCAGINAFRANSILYYFFVFLFVAGIALPFEVCRYASQTAKEQQNSSGNSNHSTRLHFASGRSTLLMLPASEELSPTSMMFRLYLVMICLRPLVWGRSLNVARKYSCSQRRSPI